MASKKKKKVQEPQYLTSLSNNPVLNYGVYVMKKSEKLLFFVGLFLVGGIVGNVFYGGLFAVDGVPTTLTSISDFVVFVVVGLIAAKIFMPVLNEMLRNRRLKTLRAQFRDFLSTLSTSLSSGMNVMLALNNAKRDLELQHGEDSFIVKEVDEMI